MTTESAAKRFYQRSYEEQRSGGSPEQHSVEDGLRRITAETHRYFSVYEELRRDPQRNVCELGFGGPELVPVLASLAKQYTIVDIIDRYGDGGVPSNVRFVACDLNDDFPFADNEFDVLVAMMVVEHLFDPFHSFRELARVTRAGGTIVMNLPIITALKHRWSLLRGRMPVTSAFNWFEKREWDGNHLHYFTVEDVRRVARLNGLELLRHYGVGAYPRLKRLAPTLLCPELSFVFVKR